MYMYRHVGAARVLEDKKFSRILVEEVLAEAEVTGLPSSSERW